MLEIKRYNVGYMGLEEHSKGRYVSHRDYVEMVEKLKKDLEILRLMEDAAYGLGRKDGVKIGLRRAIEITQAEISK